MIKRLIPVTAFAAVLGLALPATAAEHASDKAGNGERQVAAIVNDEKVYVDEVRAAQQLLPPQLQQLPLEAIYPAVLGMVVDLKLAAAAARDENLTEDPEFKREMKRIADQLLQRLYLSREIEERVTEERLKEAYKKMAADFGIAEEVKARHILVDSREEAEDIIRRLAGGDDFAEVAKEVSQGPSKTTGGDLGYFTKDSMVPEFAEAAFALQPGEVTEDPVQTQFGWHVIKVEDRRTAEPPSFEEAKEELRSEVAREVASGVVADLREKAEVEAFGLDGKPLPEEAMQQGQ